VTDFWAAAAKFGPLVHSLFQFFRSLKSILYIFLCWHRVLFYTKMLGLASLLIFVGLVTSAPTASVYSSCTVNSTSDLATAKKTCTNISIGSLTVPAGQTLDMGDLLSGTIVTFTGIVSFGYKEWTGPLVSVSGTNVKIVGAPGSCLDGDGARWWDGKGGNGGKIKVHQSPCIRRANSKCYSPNSSPYMALIHPILPE